MKVVYQLLRGEEFPTKMVQLVSDRDVDIVETKPYHVLNGCQVQRPRQLSVPVGHWALTRNCITQLCIF